MSEDEAQYTISLSGSSLTLPILELIITILNEHGKCIIVRAGKSTMVDLIGSVLGMMNARVEFPK